MTSHVLDLCKQIEDLNEEYFQKHINYYLETGNMDEASIWYQRKISNYEKLAGYLKDMTVYARYNNDELD